MSTVTRLPPFPRTVHVEADIPVSPRDEFEQALAPMAAGVRDPSRRQVKYERAWP